MLLALLSLILLPTVIAQTPLTVTVSTNQTQYSPGQTVSISGIVRDNQNYPVPGAGVSIQVNGPGDKLVHVQLVYTNQAGSYSDSFILSGDSVAGQYTVFVSANKSGYTDSQNQSQFSVQGGITTTSSTSQTTSSTVRPPICVIATAAYGSELSPEVALLRTFRDRDVLSTKAGTSFMQAFNAFYYSFSPQVASYVSSNDNLRFVTAAALYPLVGILYMASFIFAGTSSSGELAVIVSGTFAAVGLGFIYFGPIAAVVVRRFKVTKSKLARAMRTVFLLGLASLILLLLAEVTNLAGVLTLATVGIVLSSMSLGGLLAPLIAQTRKNRSNCRSTPRQGTVRAKLAIQA